MDKAREADALVDSLGKAMQSGETGLRYVPALLLRIINEDMWRDRVIAKTGERVMFNRYATDAENFLDFVITEPLEGLGADIPTLERLCASNPEALDAIDKVTKKGGGRPSKTVDNVNSLDDRPDGNTRAAALRRLRKDRPDLHKRVLSQELSPHAAMIEAGFRPKTITLPIDAVRAAGVLRRHFTEEELATIVNLLAR
jgi:hypothetical protein